MKKVNLLPAWYTRQRHERLMFRVRVLLMLLLAGAMVAWKGTSDVHLTHLKAIAGELREQRDIVRNLAKDVEVADERNAELEKRAASYRLLGQPAPIYELLQQIHNELADGMSLTAVIMEVRQDPVPGSGNVGNDRNPPRYRHTAIFRVDGIAPNDQLVAQMVDRLSHNPVFIDVSMNFTRPDVLRGFSVRRFQIRLAVDLESLPAGDPEVTLEALAEHDHDH